MIFTNEKLEIFSQKKQKFIISIYSSGEILGLEDHIYPDNELFMFSTVCLSECDIFSLEIQFMYKMMEETKLKNNYFKLITERKEKLIKRLLKLKSNIIYQYNNMIEDKTLYINTNDNKTNEKYKNVLKTKGNFIFLKPNIKEKLNNFSSEKRRVIRDSIRINIQAKNNENSLCLTSRQKESFPVPYKKNKKNNHKIYENSGFHTLRQSNTKISSLHKKIFKLNNNQLNTSSNEQIKTLKVLKINKENSKNKRSKTNPKKTLINFSSKGKVPNLLLENSLTVNKIIDKLISKEKDLYNNCLSEKRGLSESKENINETNSNIKKSTRKFISHLDILGFDKMINKISSKTKKRHLGNKIENTNSIRTFREFPNLNMQKYYNIKYS